jgi:hypothetical protein
MLVRVIAAIHKETIMPLQTGDGIRNLIQNSISQHTHSVVITIDD